MIRPVPVASACEALVPGPANLAAGAGVGRWARLSLA
jgi:hypothetical protein